MRPKLYFLSDSKDYKTKWVGLLEESYHNKDSTNKRQQTSWDISPISLSVSPLCLQITRTTMLTCLTPKWTRTSGARRPERRSALPWRSSLTYWRSIMGINSSFQTGTWSPQEVSSLSHGDVQLCRMFCRLVLLVLLLSVVICLVCCILLCICVVSWTRRVRPSLFKSDHYETSFF